MTGFDHPLALAARREVLELHALFEVWLGGTCPATDAVFARTESSLGASFTMVGLDGIPHARDEVIASLRAAHGVRGRQAAFRIVIADIELLHLEPPLVALRYVEDQCSGDARTLRRSTALFRASDRSPAGIEWLALHETCIAGAPSA